jgi:soluble cytochrome b562
MRRLIYYVLFLALAAAFSTAKDETVDDLKSHFTNASPEDRAELGIRIAQHQLRNADKLYNEGKIEQARAAVEDIADYAEKAGEAATQTKKRLKNVEIDARKMADKLRDIKRTLAVEDQPPVDQAIKRLEDVRTDLLKEMFKKKERR